MQLTTREAVEEALYSISSSARIESKYGNANEYLLKIAAATLLCEHYGFKLDQFFDVEVVE